MNLEGTTTYQVTGERAAYALAQALISESAAFVFQPLPFGVYQFSVRDEGCEIAQRWLVLTSLFGRRYDRRPVDGR